MSMTKQPEQRGNSPTIMFVGAEQASTSVLAHWSVSRGIVPRIHRSWRLATRDALATRPSAVVILGSGLDVPAAKLCREFVTKGVDAPIVVIGGPKDSIQSAFDAGAHDYVGSVLEFDQLFPRIRAWLRRPGRREARLLTLGPLVLDSEKRVLETPGSRLRLTPAESDLLAYLIDARGRVVSEKELSNAVLGSGRASSRSRIEFHLSNLRKKLGSLRPMLETVRGEGYRVTPENLKARPPARARRRARPR
jgi:DNA-binding response OmpR family regulator